MLKYRKKYYHLQIDDLNTDEALKGCSEILTNNKKKASTLFFINAHCFNLSIRDNNYLKSILSSDFILNDGIGIKLGGLLKGVRFKENMNGTDFIPKVIEQASIKKKNVFLLGGEENVVENAKEILEIRFKGLNITGFRNGYFDIKNDEEVIQLINESRAELLIVGMGVPRQELWIHESLEKLEHVRLAIAGGAILDFLAGKVKRAPVWMQKTGLEWIFRLIQEPRRLARRYLFGNLLFFINIMRKT